MNNSCHNCTEYCEDFAYLCSKCDKLLPEQLRKDLLANEAKRRDEARMMAEGHLIANPLEKIQAMREYSKLINDVNLYFINNALFSD